MDPERLDSRTFDAADLARRHPPRFENTNKRAVLAEILRPGELPAGRIVLSRWNGAAPPASRPLSRPALEERPGYFVYGAPATGRIDWHLNFAMGDCFGAYSGDLLAQDELQVLEHPGLASVREASLAEGFSVRCVEDGRATPVLVTGVERRGRLDTRPAPDRPAGLYGNEFAGALVSAVRKALSRVQPPSVSNILAIEAPSGGNGTYQRDEIAQILATAFSGFRAAMLESRRLAPKSAPPRTAVHTGFWGCGAYGGNKVLMAVLQLVAAELAQVDRLVFYSVDKKGARDLARATALYGELPPDASVGAILDRLARERFPWGTSNGT